VETKEDAENKIFVVQNLQLPHEQVPRTSGGFNVKYQERVSRIQNRLSQMQVSIDNDKQDKLQVLERQLSQTDSRLGQWNEANLKKFAVFKEKVTECLKYIEADKQATDYEQQVEQKQIQALTKSVEERFNQEKLARKDMEARLLQQIEDRFMTVRKTLSQESRNRYESIEQLKGSLENDMPRLQDIIQTETETRDARDQVIFAKIDCLDSCTASSLALINS